MRQVTSLVVGFVLVGSLSAAAGQSGGRATPPTPPAPPAAPASPQAAPPAPPPPPPAPPAPSSRAATIPLRLDIVLSRFQGEKKISSVPYTLFTAYGGTGTSSCSLQSGSNVPIPTGPAADGSEKRYTYQRIGVTISCQIFEVVDGRYRFSISVDESSLADTPASPFGAPVIRSNEMRAAIVLRDGQPQLFSVSTDKVTGETLRGEVTLAILK